MRLFGKEPAFWVGVVQAVLVLFMSWDQMKDALGLTDLRVAAIMAVINGLAALYLAFVVRETMLGALTEVAKALFGLLLAYNLVLSPGLMSAILGLIAIVGAGFLRTQASPLVKPSFTNPPTAPVLTQVNTAQAA
jgi:hypothetical protein